ncbi:methylisocitrate lyase [Salibacterium sp. K-3]
MSWYVEQPVPQEQLAQVFKQRMQQNNILKLPGVHDSMAALLAKKTGFDAMYLSGAAYTASRGLPDLGIVYSTELADRARDIVRAAKLPLLVDIDTGFGGVLHAARTAREMIEAGVAAVQIEDQALPKKCGHLNGKTLIEAAEMENKIRMIKEVAPTLAVIARTDAKGVEGINEAAARAKRYAAAGADGIFPEALTSENEFQYVKERVDAPLLANMTEFGRTPYFTAEQFEKWGYRMVIYPVTSLRAAAKAVERVFQEIQDTGTQKGRLDDMQTREELYDIIGYHDYEALDEKIAKTELPPVD